MLSAFRNEIGSVPAKSFIIHTFKNRLNALTFERQPESFNALFPIAKNMSEALPLTSAQLLCAAACVQDAQGRYLLVRTPLRGWEFPGGVVEPGESLISGLLREVEEESGYTVKPERLLALMSNISSHPPKLIALYSAQVIGGTLKTSDETPEVGWFLPDAAEALVQHPANALRWQIGKAATDSAQAGVYHAVYRLFPFELIEGKYY